MSSSIQAFSSEQPSRSETFILETRCEPLSRLWKNAKLGRWTTWMLLSHVLNSPVRHQGASTSHFGIFKNDKQRRQKDMRGLPFCFSCRTFAAMVVLLGKEREAEHGQVWRTFGKWKETVGDVRRQEEQRSEEFLYRF